MLSISELYIYPVKSLGGIAVNSAVLTDRGLQYDRRWMLIDTNNRFISQREVQQMALLGTAIENNQLVVFKKGDIDDKIVLNIEPESNALIQVQMFKDTCSATLVSAEADRWFTDALKAPCRLVFMPDEAQRQVDEQYALHDDITSLSDGFPVLMIGDASLNDLNERMPGPLHMNRFRPNIVLTGGAAFEEDTMKHFRINGIDLFAVKPCSRCSVTTIDQDTAVVGKEPLATLARYRRRNNKIYFGQNILYKGAGTIQVGDMITIKERKPPLPF